MDARGHTPGPWKADTGRGCKTIKGDKQRSGAHRQAQYVELAMTTGLSDEAEDAANAKLIAAAPALADDAEKLIALLAHIVEFAHYATDEELPSEVLRRIENEAREVAVAVGYDGTTTPALRAAGR